MVAAMGHTEKTGHLFQPRVICQGPENKKGVYIEGKPLFVVGGCPKGQGMCARIREGLGDPLAHHGHARFCAWKVERPRQGPYCKRTGRIHVKNPVPLCNVRRVGRPREGQQELPRMFRIYSVSEETNVARVQCVTFRIDVLPDLQYQSPARVALASVAVREEEELHSGAGWGPQA